MQFWTGLFLCIALPVAEANLKGGLGYVDQPVSLVRRLTGNTDMRGGVRIGYETTDDLFETEGSNKIFARSTGHCSETRSMSSSRVGHVISGGSIVRHMSLPD